MRSLTDPGGTITEDVRGSQLLALRDRSSMLEAALQEVDDGAAKRGNGPNADFLSAACVKQTAELE